jgi:hypothetical protein
MGHGCPASLLHWQAGLHVIDCRQPRQWAIAPLLFY